VWLAQRRGYQDVRVSRALVMRRYHGSVSLLDTLVYRLRLLRARTGCLAGSVRWSGLGLHMEHRREAGLHINIPSDTCLNPLALDVLHRQEAASQEVTVMLTGPPVRREEKSRRWSESVF